jgi:hypothetical protein
MIDPKCIWLIMHETSAYRDANIGINCLHPGGASCLALIHLLVTGFTWRFNPAAGCRRRAFRLRFAIGWIIKDLRKAVRSVPGLAE